MKKEGFLALNLVMFIFLFVSCGESEKSSVDIDVVQDFVDDRENIVEEEIFDLDVEETGDENEFSDSDSDTVESDDGDSIPQKVYDEHLEEMPYATQIGAMGSSSNDVGTSAAVDSEGFIYITGYTDGVIEEPGNYGGWDGLLIKTTPNGEVVWKQQFGTNTSDSVVSVKVDSNKDVYVIGNTSGSFKNDENVGGTFIIKWKNDGTQQWLKQFPVESVKGVAIDTDDTFIMVGFTDNDYVLSRWNSEGEKLWTKILGDASLFRTAEVIIAKNGEIIVSNRVVEDGDTGSCNCFGNAAGTAPLMCFQCSDFSVSRYTKDGEMIWTKTFGTAFKDDTPYHIVENNNGDIFLTGTTQGSFPDFQNAGGNCGQSRSGYQVFSQPCTDQFLVNIDASGNLVWIDQWGEEGNDKSGVVSATSDQLLTTGSTMISHNFQGDKLWRKESGVEYWSDIVLTTDNTFTTVGKTPGADNEDYDDIYFGVWDIEGNLKESNVIEGFAANDVITALAKDSDGTIVGVGQTDGTFPKMTNIGKNDIFLVKWLPDSEQMWVGQIGSDGDDIATDITIDIGGNIYVSGYSDGAFKGEENLGSDDAFLMKWNRDGELIWIRQWGDEFSEKANGVTVDIVGNIYVTGTNKNEKELFLKKMNSDGDELWSVIWEAEESSSSVVANAVAVDSDGKIAVTGNILGVFPGKENGGQACLMSVYSPHQMIPRQIPIDCTDMFVSLFSPDGKILNHIQWGNEYNQDGIDIEFDSRGDIIVSGEDGTYTNDGGRRGASNTFLLKLSTEGLEIWSNKWESEYGNTPTALFVDSDDNMLITGNTYKLFNDELETAGLHDPFIVKVDPDGSDLFAYQWGSNVSDYATGVVAGDDGKVYVAGYTYGIVNGKVSKGGIDSFLTTLTIE